LTNIEEKNYGGKRGEKSGGPQVWGLRTVDILNQRSGRGADCPKVSLQTLK